MITLTEADLANAILACREELEDAVQNRKNLAKPLYYTKGNNVRIAHDVTVKRPKGKKHPVTHYAGEAGVCIWIGDAHWGPGIKKAGVKFVDGVVVWVNYGDAVNDASTAQELALYRQAKAKVVKINDALTKLLDDQGRLDDIYHQQTQPVFSDD